MGTYFIKVLFPGLVFGVVLITSCGAPPEKIHEKLHEIAKNDLKDIISELPEKNKARLLLDNPHYKIDTLEIFQGDSSRIYQAYAVVYFFYLEGIQLCQLRKYRFLTTGQVWDRYQVDLISTPEKFITTEKS